MTTRRERAWLWVRWVLVAPWIWAGWIAAALTGLAASAALDGLCPSGQMVSDLCGAPWYGPAMRVVFCYGTGSAAALMILLGSVMAPSHNGTVALAIYAAGATTAVIIGLTGFGWAEPTTAIIVGGIVTWRLRQRFRLLIHEPSAGT